MMTINETSTIIVDLQQDNVYKSHSTVSTKNSTKD